LHGYDFTVEYAFNKALKFFKELKYFRFFMKEINTCEFAIIINEIKLVLLVAKGINDKTPNIRRRKYLKGAVGWLHDCG
jgi:hypothetical protein